MKSQFPIFKTNPDLIYLDSASTTQKPQVVIDGMSEFLSSDYANVHRGMYPLAEASTRLWEETHDRVAYFIRAKSREEIILTSGTTASLNLVTQLLIKNLLKDGDIVVLSEMEHHSNIIPWKLGQKYVNYEIAWIPVTDKYQLDFEWYKEFIAKNGDRVKVVSLVHTSNVLGVTNDVASYFELAHRVGAIAVLDAAQSIVHHCIDVSSLGCDFLVFSGHKIYGPTGIGVLYGRSELLERYEPVYGGGDMISSVSKSEVTYNDLPWKFEPGTPNIVGGVGLTLALDWYEKEVKCVDCENCCKKVNVTEEGCYTWSRRNDGTAELTTILFQKLSAMPEVEIFSTQEIIDSGSSLLAFSVKDIHPHDIVSLLGEKGICVRGGYHCAEILHKQVLGKPNVRCSFGAYNTEEDIEKFVDALANIIVMFK